MHNFFFDLLASFICHHRREAKHEVCWSNRTTHTSACHLPNPAGAPGTTVSRGPQGDETPSTNIITHGEFELNTVDQLHFSSLQAMLELE